MDVIFHELAGPLYHRYRVHQLLYVYDYIKPRNVATMIFLWYAQRSRQDLATDMVHVSNIYLEMKSPLQLVTRTERALSFDMESVLPVDSWWFLDLLMPITDRPTQ